MINADVTTVDLPTTDLLVHLYHPFETTIFAEVLQRLEDSLATPRRVTIAYLAYSSAVAPVVETLERFPWLHLVRYEQSIHGHYDWMFWTNHLILGHRVRPRRSEVKTRIGTPAPPGASAAAS